MYMCECAFVERKREGRIQFTIKIKRNRSADNFAKLDMNLYMKKKKKKKYSLPIKNLKCFLSLLT